MSAASILRTTAHIVALSVVAYLGPQAFGNGEKLYGVHWWDFDNGAQVGTGPTGGWSTETVITHSAPRSSRSR